MELSTETKRFLNQEQKKVKQEIMDKLMDSLFGIAQKNLGKFDNQSMMDLLLSCMIMFNRDVYSHIFINSNMLPNWKKVLRHINSDIEDLIEKKIEEVKKEFSC